MSPALKFILYCFALVCFVVAAAPISRASLLPAGLAFWVAVKLIETADSL